MSIESKYNRMTNYSPVRVDCGEFGDLKVGINMLVSDVGLTPSSAMLLEQPNHIDCGIDESDPETPTSIEAVIFQGSGTIYDRNTDTFLQVEGLSGKCTVNDREIYLSELQPTVEIFSAGKLIFGLSYVSPDDPELNCD